MATDFVPNKHTQDVVLFASHHDVVTAFIVARTFFLHDREKLSTERENTIRIKLKLSHEEVGMMTHIHVPLSPLLPIKE